MRPKTVLHPLLLLIVACCVHAQVYSCEQVRKLINTEFAYKADSLMVDTEENFTQDNFNELNNILFSYETPSGIRGHTSGWNNSEGRFDSLANATWQFKMDNEINELNCTQEFIVYLFDEYPSEFITTALKEWRQKTDIETNTLILTSPATGMLLKTDSCDGDVNLRLWSGMGEATNGSIIIRSWTCSDVPKWILSFDIVIALSYEINNGTYTVRETSDLNSSLTVSSTDKIFIYTGGRVNNLHSKEGGAENRVRFTIGKGEPHYVTFDTDLFFDSNNTGSFDLLKSPDTDYISYRNGTNLTEFSSAYFEVQYNPTRIPAQDVDKSMDEMIIEITIGGLVATPAPTTAAVVTTTSKPRIQGPHCSCGLTETGAPRGWNYSDIWLDIVVILDTSEAMGKQGLEDAGALVESFLSDGDTIDFLVTDKNATYYSRIGVICMAANATILYDLNMSKDDKVQGKAAISDGITNINVIDAFEEALKMFERGSMNNTYRNTTRRVIYYITDSDPKNNLNPVNQFKASKGVIIVNHFIQEGEVELTALQELASDGYYFKNDHYDRALQYFCKANCFCTREKNAYRVGDDVAIIASGGCYHAASAGVPYNKAKITCERGNGILAAIHDNEKEEFVRSQMTDADSKYFWIGYRKDKDGDWMWADNSSVPYDNWNDETSHDESGSLCAYAKTNTTAGMEWGADSCLSGFPYVCEYPPCSVGFDTC